MYTIRGQRTASADTCWTRVCLRHNIYRLIDLLTTITESQSYMYMRHIVNLLAESNILNTQYCRWMIVKLRLKIHTRLHHFYSHNHRKQKPDKRHVKLWHHYSIHVQLHTHVQLHVHAVSYHTRSRRSQAPTGTNIRATLRLQYDWNTRLHILLNGWAELNYMYIATEKKQTLLVKRDYAVTPNKGSLNQMLYKGRTERP